MSQALHRLRRRVAESADVLRDGWRGILLAVIGGAIALLIAEAAGDSDDAEAVAVLVGGAAGAATHHLATRLRWRDRTLSSLAAVAATLAVPGARSWVADRARAGAITTASSSAKATSIGATVLTAGIGAATVLAVSGAAGNADSARAETPEAAIAAYLKNGPAEYVGSCAGRSQSEFDAHPRRVCSRAERHQDGGRLFAIAQPGWLDQIPIVLLREDDARGWVVVGCVFHC
jgi:hypothetical protein